MVPLTFVVAFAPDLLLAAIGSSSESDVALTSSRFREIR